jgi:elongation factor G
MMESLKALTEEDPTFRVGTDENTGQTIISGMGELHLEILVERLIREFRVQARVGRPQVAYRETITRSVTVEEEFSAQRGTHTLYARVKLQLSPLPKGGTFQFVNGLVGSKMPLAFIKNIEAALREAMASGVLAGYPLVDIRVELLDVAYEEDQNAEGAVQSAAVLAFSRGLREAEPILLEPNMRVEVVVPEENMGDVIGDLNARRGVIEGMEPRIGGMHAIRGHVPLAETFGYATDLRSGTQGRGAFTLEFDHYLQVPESVSNRILGMEE